MEQSARYAYKVFQEQSITKAAEKLFISQPALSAAIARHEKELGFQIFNRATLPISLTPKGHIYMESLGQILSIEEDARLRIREASDRECGQIAIGCSNTAAYSLLPDVYADFERAHPEVKMTIDLGNNSAIDNLLQKLLQNKIDFYLCGSKPNIKCKTVRLQQEPILVAVSKGVEIPDSLRQFAVTYNELCDESHEQRAINGAEFKDVPFINYYTGTSMFKTMHKILGDYKSVPIRIINAKNGIVHCQLAKKGVGAVFVTVSTAKEFFSQEDDMLFFHLDHQQAEQELYICSNADSEITPIMQDFLDICRRRCTPLETGVQL